MPYSEDPLRRRSQRALSMVAELHKRGYQRLRISPLSSPDDDVWRCALTPASNVMRSNGIAVAYFDMSNTLIYDPEDRGASLFGDEGQGASARRLADVFLGRFGSLPEACRGRDWAYAGWFLEVLGAAELGYFPAIEGDRSTDSLARLTTLRFPDATGEAPQLLSPPPGEAVHAR